MLSKKGALIQMFRLLRLNKRILCIITLFGYQMWGIRHARFMKLSRIFMHAVKIADIWLFLTVSVKLDIR